MPKKMSSKQQTLDFFFSPKPSQGQGSPNLKHFNSYRPLLSPLHDVIVFLGEGSPQSSSLTVAANWMDVDFEDSDDEPIAKYKKGPKKRSSSRSSTPPITSKRSKQEDVSVARSDVAESIFEEKLQGWSTQLTQQLDAVTEEPPYNHSAAPSAVIAGLGHDHDVQETRLQENKKFAFLHPDKICDSKGRRPEDPDYDPSSFFIPPTWFDQYNISAAQRQWWTFKASNFDALLLFKVGKFYELYEMDAHAAVEALGLKYMKGDRPHCGFPESAYAQMAGGLAEKGYRVAVIEQTETPEQLKERNQELKRQGKAASKVVSREQVAVITKGTITESDMMSHQSEANYLMSIYSELKDEGVLVGICAVDVASMLDPVEFLLPVSGDAMSVKLRKTVEQVASSARVNAMSIDKDGFPDVGVAVSMIISYFGTTSSKNRPSLPDCLKTIEADQEEHMMVLKACGAVVNFLKKGLLDEAVIPVSTFSFIPDNSANQVSDSVALDSSAIENLEVFFDSDGKSSGSLFASLDHCTTPFGRRLLKRWIAQPLIGLDTIHERQQAVEDLLTVGAAAAGKLRNALATVGDLERLLVRLHANSLEGIHAGRYADHVILYEDATKKKVSVFVCALDGLTTANAAVSAFEDVVDRLSSGLLKRLVTKGEGFPDMDGPLESLMSAADWKEAKKTGRVIPTELPYQLERKLSGFTRASAQGISALGPYQLRGAVFAYDAAMERVKEAERDLDIYLDELKVSLKSKTAWEVSRLAVKKDRYVIEVADRLVTAIPNDFERISQRKGFKRFTSPQFKRRIQSLELAEGACDEQRSHVLHDLLMTFLSHSRLWNAAVQAMSQLDCLMSLMMAAVSIQGPSCRPEFVPWSDQSSPIFKAVGLRHPNLKVKGTFIPNDIELGGDQPNFIVLTGANMGGKSTCLRQVCMAAIMAQIGGWVPAEKLLLTPVDGIFVRMGARDRIVCGQSTFFVELFETASMLRRASMQSLVVLDELGRGTATRDGEAIAHAVLHRLSTEIKCRGLFATHYHSLAKTSTSNPCIALKHMACEVMESDDEIPDVKFLYKVVEGVAPKSYGMQVARLAGLAKTIVQMANTISSQMEDKWNQAKTQTAPRGGSNDSHHFDM